jgi:hypothetical protein
MAPLRFAEGSFDALKREFEIKKTTDGRMEAAESFLDGLRRN